MQATRAGSTRQRRQENTLAPLNKITRSMSHSDNLPDSKTDTQADSGPAPVLSARPARPHYVAHHAHGWHLLSAAERRKSARVRRWLAAAAPWKNTDCGAQSMLALGLAQVAVRATGVGQHQQFFSLLLSLTLMVLPARGGGLTEGHARCVAGSGGGGGAIYPILLRALQMAVLTRTLRLALLRAVGLLDLYRASRDAGGGVRSQPRQRGGHR